MPLDLDQLWKNTPTPEMEKLARKLTNRRLDDDYEDFGNDLSAALFLAFKAGFEAAEARYPDSEN
jgi:hypothetical protein